MGIFGSFFEKLKERLSRQMAWDADDGYPFFGNPLVRLIAAFSVAVIIGSFGAVYLFIVRGGGDTIVLHYNAYFGVDIVGAPEQTYFLPGMAVFFFLVNLILAARFYEGRERIASHMLLFSGLFIALSSGVAVAALSFINT